MAHSRFGRGLVAGLLLAHLGPAALAQSPQTPGSPAPDKSGLTLKAERRGREDYAWLSDGTLVISAGTKILAMKPAADADWREIADFEAMGLKDLTRLATNGRGDQIAIVASPK